MKSSIKLCFIILTVLGQALGGTIRAVEFNKKLEQELLFALVAKVSKDSFARGSITDVLAEHIGILLSQSKNFSNEAYNYEKLSCDEKAAVDSLTHTFCIAIINNRLRTHLYGNDFEDDCYGGLLKRTLKEVSVYSNEGMRVMHDIVSICAYAGSIVDSSSEMGCYGQKSFEIKYSLLSEKIEIPFSSNFSRRQLESSLSNIVFCGSYGYYEQMRKYKKQMIHPPELQHKEGKNDFLLDVLKKYAEFNDVINDEKSGPEIEDSSETFESRDLLGSLQSEVRRQSKSLDEDFVLLGRSSLMGAESVNPPETAVGTEPQQKFVQEPQNAETVIAKQDSGDQSRGTGAEPLDNGAMAVVEEDFNLEEENEVAGEKAPVVVVKDMFHIPKQNLSALLSLCTVATSGGLVVVSQLKTIPGTRRKIPEFFKKYGPPLATFVAVGGGFFIAYLKKVK